MVSVSFQLFLWQRAEPPNVPDVYFNHTNTSNTLRLRVRGQVSGGEMGEMQDVSMLKQEVGTSQPQVQTQGLD